MTDHTDIPRPIPVPQPDQPVVAGDPHWSRRVMISASLLSLLAACGGGGGGGDAIPAPGPAPTPTPPPPPPVSPPPPANAMLTVLAGIPSGSGTADGTALAARFTQPGQITRDSTNLYVADTANNLIRKIVLATGAVTTLAGSSQKILGDGNGAAAGFNAPQGVAVDGAGNLYVADTGNHTIRKIVIATGEVTTFAGVTGQAQLVDGVGAVARFAFPGGLATDGLGSLFVADIGNSNIRRIDIATAAVTTFAGSTAGAGGFANGTGTAARFGGPVGVASDGALGNLYVADTGNSVIRRIVLATRVVTTLAGTSNSIGTTDGTGAAARFFNPKGVACNSAGDVFVADTGNHTVRRITTAGVVTTLAGTAGSAGFIDAQAAAARFNSSQGLVVDGTNIYLNDTGNNTIRKVTTDTATVTTYAGPPGAPGSNDGPGPAARFNAPAGLASDGVGNLYVADRGNFTVRKVAIASRAVTTLAGSAGMVGNVNATGSAARFDTFNGIASDGTNLYLADSGNQAVRRIVIATGEVTTFAGSTTRTRGFSDGTSGAASFSNLNDVAADGAGTLFVADLGNQTIRRVVVASAAVTTLAGTARNFGSADGTGLAAAFANPAGAAADNAGNVYVCDRDNHTIRKIVVATGAVTTIAGGVGQPGFVNGIGAAARFNQPVGIATDSAGNLYIADSKNSAIRRLAIATGEVSTLVGKAGQSGVVPGLLSAATLNNPAFLKVIAGKLYATDTVDNVVVQIDL